MQFLYFLEKIRVPVLNEFMLAVTTLGEETAFLVIALILFWCVDKYIGYYTLSVGFVGTLANQFLKLCFRIPRPWVLDENFTILEQAREAASGYSFPSGHTQSAVGTFGSIACVSKKKIIRIIAIVIAVLVPISRMYIGVHTPLDVVVSIAIALLLIFVFRPLILGKEHTRMPTLLGIMLLLAVGYLCFVEFYPFPQDIDPHNYESGLQNAYTLLGALLGMLAVYWIDEKWLKFKTNAVWWAQILKVVVGLILVLVVKSGTKPLLNMLLGEYFGRAVRYFLVVVFAGILWPMTFKWFSKLGKKE
ncbi:MAG: phosphatase PAP2 family protein [Oscillospiraceae bacterium]|nr:phosphatase PAP2 family protein [Oscillospiraceae bacterium]